MFANNKRIQNVQRVQGQYQQQGRGLVANKWLALCRSNLVFKLKQLVCTRAESGLFPLEQDPDQLVVICSPLNLLLRQ